MLTLFIYQGLSLVILCKDFVEGPSDSTILSTLAEAEDCEASETLILATEDHPGPFQTNCAVLSRSFIFFSSSKPARRIRGWPWGVTGPGLEVWEDHLDSLNDSHLVGVILQSPDGSGETEFRYLKFSPSVTSGSLQASTPCFRLQSPTISLLSSLSVKSRQELPSSPAGQLGEALWRRRLPLALALLIALVALTGLLTRTKPQVLGGPCGPDRVRGGARGGGRLARTCRVTRLDYKHTLLLAEA